MATASATIAMIAIAGVNVANREERFAPVPIIYTPDPL